MNFEDIPVGRFLRRIPYDTDVSIETDSDLWPLRLTLTDLTDQSRDFDGSTCERTVGHAKDRPRGFPIPQGPSRVRAALFQSATFACPSLAEPQSE